MFQAILSAIFFGLIAAAFFTYAAGNLRAGKALLISVPAAGCIGYLVGIAVVLATVFFSDGRGEGSGSGVYLFGIVGGLIAAILALVTVFFVLLRRLKPSSSNPQYQVLSFFLGLVCAFLTLNSVYAVTPRLHPTSRLIRDATGTGGSMPGSAHRELVRRGEDVVPHMVEYISNHPQREGTRELPRIIGEIPGEKASRALLLLLKNPRPDIRVQAAQQLAKRKEKRALNSLLAMLSDEDLDPRSKSGLINAIAELGEPSAVPQILIVSKPSPVASTGGSQQLLYDLALVKAMGRLKHPQAYEFLVGLRDHSNTRVRRAIIEQLGNYPCRRTARVLIELLLDSDGDVRIDADKKLAELTGRYRNSSGRRRSPEGSEKIREDWLRWMEKNGSTMPDQPSYDEGNP